MGTVSSVLPRPDRCVVMGILNITPDSFSDGGRHLDTARAIEHGLLLAAQGADIIDLGGESTRPGAHRVPVEVELSRVLPVVRELAAAQIFVSIDTMRAEVAEASVAVGAAMINDVSGGLADRSMATFVAEAGVPYIATHWRGQSAVMREHARYDNVRTAVILELRARVHALLDAGVGPEQIIIDPGLGFAKTPEHDWELLRNLDDLHVLGHPLLIGASRKSFLGALLPSRSPGERDVATAAVSALAAARGAWGVRVHDVPSTLDAVRVARQFRPSVLRFRLSESSSSAQTAVAAGMPKRPAKTLRRDHSSCTSGENRA